MNFIKIFFLITIFFSCSTSKKAVRVDINLLKEIWQGDPCGMVGNCKGISHLLVDACDRKALNMSTLSFIIGKPSRVDTLNNEQIKYSYIVSSGTKGCDTLLFNDVVHIGLLVFYDMKENKIISCQTNLY